MRAPEADLWDALVLGVRDYLGKNGFPVDLPASWTKTLQKPSLSSVLLAAPICVASLWAISATDTVNDAFQATQQNSQDSHKEEENEQAH